MSMQCDRPSRDYIALKQTNSYRGRSPDLACGFQEGFFFDAFRRGALWVAVVGFLQVGSSSPQMIEPVEGGASAISIALFVAASIAKSLPLNFPTLRTWFA